MRRLVHNSFSAILLAILGSNGTFAASSPYTIIHTFGSGADGAGSMAGVIEYNGALYGTTMYGGTSTACEGGCGVVYMLTAPAGVGTQWTETIIHNFGLADGGYPMDSVVFGSDGSIYGTTSVGGTGKCGKTGCGTVFQLSPPVAGSGVWTETVLHSFVETEGTNPSAPVIVGSDGSLYGTTTEGANKSACSTTYGAGCGTIFQVTPPSSTQQPWPLQVLYTFTRKSGNLSTGGLLLGPGGVLYGANQYEGPGNEGTIFKLTPPAAGTPWVYSVVYAAGESTGPMLPDGPLLMDGNGSLYETSIYGGPDKLPFCSGGGCGTIVKLTPPTVAGAAWSEQTLFEFNGHDGSHPRSGVVMDTAGNLYGTTLYGGSGKDKDTGGSCAGVVCGVVFELVPPSAPSTQWTEQILANFIQGKTTFAPNGVILDAEGRLFGTTSYGNDGNGGGSYQGVVFEIKP